MLAPATDGAVDSQQSTILCVDLDGTLVTTDTLDESIVCLIRERAVLLFAMPWWLLSGMMSDDPVLFSLRDKGSYALAFATLLLMLIAS